MCAVDPEAVEKAGRRRGGRGPQTRHHHDQARGLRVRLRVSVCKAYSFLQYLTASMTASIAASTAASTGPIGVR